MVSSTHSTPSSVLWTSLPVLIRACDNNISKIAFNFGKVKILTSLNFSHLTLLAEIYPYCCKTVVVHLLDYYIIFYYVMTTTTKSLQSCPTLCDPMDCSLPGSSLHGIFWGTVLEWGAIAFSLYYVNLPFICSLHL